MTPFQSYLAMLRYHMRRPLSIWVMVGFLTLDSVFVSTLTFWFPRMESSGFGVDLATHSIFINVLMGVVFVMNSMKTPVSSSAWILPNAEFLIIRPVSRAAIFITLIGLYFSVLLVGPVLSLILTAHHPDLLLSLYQRGAQSIEAVRGLATYQQVFPSSSVTSSSILHSPQGVHLLVLIPLGLTWEALWNLWEVVLFGLVVQAFSLIHIPKTSRRIVSGVLSTSFALAFLFWTRMGAPIDTEKLFFFFVQHWELVVILTIASFALVQWATWRRIQEIEVL